MSHDSTAVSAGKIQALFRGYQIRKLLRLSFHYYYDICQSIDKSIQRNCPHYNSSHYLKSISFAESETSSSLTQPLHTIVSSLLFPSDVVQNQLLFADKHRFEQYTTSLINSSASNDSDNVNRRKAEENELCNLVKEAEWLENAILDRIRVISSNYLIYPFYFKLTFVINYVVKL